jgi:thiol-disulfide isomerase/thioredoxin
MRNLLIYILSFLLCISLAAGQSPLATGDTLPHIALQKMLNHGKGKGNTSDFRGKGVILDFWDIHCPACIAAMPKLDSLQKLFSGQLQVVIVTNNSVKDVTQFLSRLPKFAKLKFPYVLEDTLLSAFFPHTIIPHEVWISSSGKVKAITSHEEVTARNISAFLEGKDFLATKKVDKLKWNADSSMGFIFLISGRCNCFFMPTPADGCPT